jgi:hypothetical protein
LPLPDRALRKRTTAFAALVADSRPLAYNVSSYHDDQKTSGGEICLHSLTSKSSSSAPASSAEAVLSWRCRVLLCCRLLLIFAACIRTSWAEVWISCNNKAETVRMDRPSLNLGKVMRADYQDKDTRLLELTSLLLSV